MSAEPEERERAIVKVISERDLGTQAALVEALTELGFEVTQATVSRDVRRLGLVKAPLPEGGFRYTLPAGVTKPRPLALSSFVTGYADAEAFTVIKTLPGRAMAVAVAIDEVSLPGVTGTLAGDDLVLVLIARAQDKGRIESQLREL